LLALYTYGAGIDEPLTMECNGQTYYYHRDALGSVTELSDASGAIVERYEYDVYGAVIETTPEHPFYTTEGEWVPAGALTLAL
jgi:YD repeat-containing protein